MNITQDTPVGSIVVERLGRASVFERLGIDYCCHGATPLEKACAERSLDVDHVLAEIAESDQRGVNEDVDRVDYSAMPAGDLADQIVATHHVYLRRELPRLSELIDKVVAAHSSNHPELIEVRQTFAALRQELEMHLMKEERVLFPLVKQLEAALEPFSIHCGTVENPIRVMEHEHDSAGSALQRIRELTSNYRAPDDGCASFTALYDGLSCLESDLHLHIHKENNILFPRAAALESALMAAKG
ncbi:MAG: iron-sulfur cluster repair di-iron protein [Planctomycetaceae bacterium]|nr:iron-sulfur cluster repair di-iron protein [Planctomycetaceae bacterium]MBV8310539.1 iron-sulfur cluster repair di-iron protein [Planctomycetaceae bacterium]